MARSSIPSATRGHMSTRSKLDAECIKLQALINHNREERTRVEREMPLIDCLSSEILSRIFQFAAAFPCCHINELPSSFVVSRVSRRWWSVAVNDASLWTKLRVFPGTSSAIIDIYLSYSRQRLLDIIVHLSPLPSSSITPSSLQDLFAAIVSASDRWRSLTILTSDVGLLYRAEEHLVGVIAPKLTSLQLSSFSDNRVRYESRLPNLFATSTSLKHLVLHRQCVNERFTSAGRITTLHLAGIVMANYEQLRSILSRSTTLEYLDLEITFQQVSASPFEGSYQGVIRLPSLHTLHLRGALCLHLFNAPILHTLYLAHDPIFSTLCRCVFNPAYTQCEDLARSLEHMGAYRFRGIRHFGVFGAHVEFILASLVLMEEKACLGALIPSAKFRPYWPKLETISLPALRPDVAGWVCRFMIARFPAIGIRLPKVRLPTTFAADPLAEWLQEKSCLELYKDDIDLSFGGSVMGLGDVVKQQ